MIREKFLDILDDTGKFSFFGWRCLLCGEVTDPTILAHRRKQTRPMISRNRKRVVGVN
ncbi:MAG TPA: hypothetical protein VN944_08800 [Nitrospiria bacterium]|nr:hypothetical protein [Nitrospiria bacterium]